MDMNRQFLIHDDTPEAKLARLCREGVYTKEMLVAWGFSLEAILELFPA
ncbi:TPA: hypothetical protein ACGO2X_000010 [Streptococcus suis]